MVKSSSIKRMLMRVKVEHQGVKYQNELLEDIFEDKQERIDPVVVYKSLKLQMHLVVFILQAILCQWNFSAVSAVFVSLLVLLIPVDIKDQDGNIVQVGGYFGILDGWQINTENLLQMRQHYFISLFASLNFYIVNNFLQFAMLLNEEFYQQGVKYFLLDMCIYGILVIPSILGLISATGCCSKIFNKLLNLQRMKLFLIMSVLSGLALIFSTQMAIKMLAVFILIGGIFQAPSTIGASKGKRVIHV
uniref:Transmembrane domain-containing protein n=1 Tax=Trepomonas sp. PC1 TaxID=1076344 RepID=A0A146KN34_9EUKA|eukprot:JAP96469.1 Transmembrane domain-containing protein [Trepomonas sp. PC1]